MRNMAVIAEAIAPKKEMSWGMLISSTARLASTTIATVLIAMNMLPIVWDV